MFPPKGGSLPPPKVEMARAAAGTYVPSEAGLHLSVGRGALDVAARGDGALILRGVERTVVRPHAGGYWRNDALGYTVHFAKGRLAINGATYNRVVFWRQSWFYLLLGLSVLVAGAYAYWREFRCHGDHDRARRACRLVSGLGFALLFVLAIAAWLLGSAF